MFVKQVSIFVENKNGSIAEVISILGENNINIRALSVADTADYGILRLIVDDSKKAYELIKNANYTLKLTDVLGFIVPDRPNGLGEVLNILHKENIEITYIYTFIGHYKDHAVAIIKTTNLDKTNKILENNGIEILTNDEIYKK